MLDQLEGGTDYLLDVAAVDLDETREKELNVRLNSISLQGTYDMEALESLIRETEGIDLNALGFSMSEINQFLPDLAAAPDLAEITPAVQEEIRLLQDTRGDDTAGNDDAGSDDQAEAVDDGNDEEESEADRIAEMKRIKAAYRERARQGDQLTYVTFVFGDGDELARFLKAAGFGSEATQDGRDLAEKMGIDLEKLP